MKRFLLFVFAIVTFAACEQAPIEEQSAIRQDAPETLTVGFEGDDTRVQLNKAQKTVWNNGDEVSVFYRSNGNQKWQYKGEDGVRQANLSRVQDATGNTAITKTIVVYPYNETYWLNTDSYCIEATTPATQHYAVDSYGVGDNLMVSQGEFTQISLKNVYGWLKLQLTGDGETIKSIKFRGNDGEQVAGLIYVDTATAEATLAAEMGDADDNNAGGNLVFEDTILSEVTLDCDEGVALGKNATAFYIALPPQTFEQGFTVEIKDTEGYVMEQSTDKALLIERNHIQPMAAFEFINPNRPTQPTPASNQIWYTATEKADPYFDDFLTFGSNVDSNVWDSETKRGIITFDGDVTMIGDDAFYNCDKLTGIALPDSVTSIGEKAFYDCGGLIEFTIPDSVTSIGNYAFYKCTSLTSVNIPDSVTTIGESAFEDCTSLTSVNIPDSITWIGNSVFWYCASLTSVNIPDSVTAIGNEAFAYCDSLTSVTIGDSVTTIGEGAFQECTSLKEFTGKFAEDNGRILVVDGVLTAFAPAGITEYNIPDSVTTIGNSTFSNCDSLTSVNIPDSVTTIGESAFLFCDSLTSVNIPDSVTTIGNSAFQYCSSLTSVNIPDSVATIGYSAFYSCDSLTSVTIGDSVTTIGEGAFRFCDSLKKVYCYASIPPSLGSSAFEYNASGRRIYVYEECVELYIAAWSSYKDSIYTNGKNCPETTTIVYTTNDGNIVTTKNMPIVSNIYDNGVGTLVVVGKIALLPNYAFKDCYSLTSVNIPDSVTTIGESAFGWCYSLTSVNIPDSVTEIGYQAFRECDSLTSVNIPDSVTTIVEYAFGECDSLTSVNIGDSVTEIGWGAFRYCTSLTSVYCKAATPPSLSTDVFVYNSSGRKIYVPAGSVNAYKSATYWSGYASAIVGYDFENGVVVE